MVYWAPNDLDIADASRVAVVRHHVNIMMVTSFYGPLKAFAAPLAEGQPMVYEGGTGFLFGRVPLSSTLQFNLLGFGNVTRWLEDAWPSFDQALKPHLGSIDGFIVIAGGHALAGEADAEFEASSLKKEAEYILALNLPLVIAVAAKDGVQTVSSQDARQLLSLPPSVAVIPCALNDPDSIRAVLLQLLKRLPPDERICTAIQHFEN